MQVLSKYIMVSDRFSNIDVLRCFFLVGEKGPISKKEMYFHLDLDDKIITDILLMKLGLDLHKKEVVILFR